MTRDELPGDELNPVTGGPWVPRTVKSFDRKPRPERRVIGVYLTDGHALGLPGDGGLRLADELLVAEMRASDKLIVATTQPAELWRYLDAASHGDASYRAHGTIARSRPYLATGGMGGVLQERATFAGFGWGKSARHLVLDPAGWSEDHWWRVLGLSRHEEHPWAIATALAEWASRVESWLASRGFDPRASKGGVSAQMLRDTRWFPERRRRVPRLVNDAARPHLPGNHYLLAEGAAGVHPQATELDLRGAHHQAAAAVAFTDPDDLYIRGSMLRETPPKNAGWRPGDPGFAELLDCHGLLRVEVDVPSEARAHPDLPPPGSSGEARVWSVDVPDLQSEGVVFRRIIGAAVSRTSSDALNRFGEWARAELAAATAADLRWLKPLLLACYGLLAQAPRPLAGFTAHPTKRGKAGVVVMGADIIDVFTFETERAGGANYVNVCDRGLIEAWTRGTIRRAAAMLEAEHRGGMAGERDETVRVLAERADSLIVTGEPADARSWAEWAADEVGNDWHEDDRTNLTLHSATHFESDEACKLPGVPRAGRPDQEARGMTFDEVQAFFNGSTWEPDPPPEQPPILNPAAPATWRQLTLEGE